MNIDKFGHHVHKRMRLSELFDFNEKALIKSDNGDFDVKTLRLRGIRSPKEADDAANKDYVDHLNANTIKELNKLIGSLRAQITIDVRNTVQATLKGKIPEVLSHLQDNFYTKADIDKLLQKTTTP